MAYRNADGQHLIDFGKDNKLVYHPRYFNKKNKEIYLTLQEIHAKEEKKREEKKREKEINSVPYEDAASSLYIEMLSKDNVLEVIKNIWREKYQINNVEKKLNEGTFEFEKYNEKSKRRYPIALPHPVETICCIEDFLPIIKEKIKKTIQSIIKNEIRWHDELPDDNKQKFISYLKSKKYTLEQIAGLEEPKILQSFLLESERGKEIFNRIIKEGVDKMIAENNLGEYFKTVEKKRALESKVSKIQEEIEKLEKIEEEWRKRK